MMKLDFVTATKALADRSRVRVLRLLMERELCVCQVIETIRLAPSTVSKHLLLLKRAGLVDSRKSGRWIHYRLAAAARGSVAADALALVRKGLRGDPRVQGDLRRLQRVLRCDPEVLCRKQAAR